MIGQNIKTTKLVCALITNLSIVLVGGYGCSNSDTKFGSNNKILGKQKLKDVATNNTQFASEAEEAPKTAVPSPTESPKTAVPPTTKTFLSSKINNGSMDFDFATKEVQSSITMDRTTGGQFSFVQSDRPKVEKTFQQVVNISSTSEVFVPQDIGLVDILAVIDDSGSMQPFQDKIAPKLAPLLSAIESKNWRIGVTTTSYSSSKQKFATFNKGETDVNLSFKNYINTLGTTGDTDERGVDQAKWALDRTGFLRAGSSIAVLVVSDENNCKSGQCGQNQVQSLLDKFTALGRKSGETVKVYSIIVPKLKSECLGLASAADHGADYQALSDLTGGVVGKICDADYTPILSRISSDIASLLMNQFSLKNVPTGIKSLQMTVGDTKTQLTEADYDLVGQNITFKMRPPANSTFSVVYELMSSDIPLIKSFNIGEIPYDGSLMVYVNNIEVKSGFSLVGSSLEFTTPPPSGSSIKATWKRNTSLPRSFALDVGSLSVDLDNLQATVNGQAQNFTRNGTSILFDTAPEPLASVVIKYELANLVYDFSPGPIVAGSLKAVDQTGKVLNPVFSNNKLKFEMNEFQSGRVVTLTHKPEWSTGSRTISLAHSPLEGSLVLKGKVNGPCSDITLDSAQKTVAINCEMLGETGVNITYDYLTDVRSMFSAEDVPACDKSSYQVFISQVATSNFSVNQCIVTVNDPLPNGSEVKIIITPN